MPPARVGALDVLGGYRELGRWRRYLTRAVVGSMESLDGSGVPAPGPSLLRTRLSIRRIELVTFRAYSCVANDIGRCLWIAPGVAAPGAFSVRGAALQHSPPPGHRFLRSVTSTTFTTRVAKAIMTPRTRHMSANDIGFLLWIAAELPRSGHAVRASEKKGR